uniref:Uncharacterized protein n=1 Tax=Aureoumbra lagunensis TaxID=44058 RepID=A0A7S3K5W2_9STRA
MHRVFLLVLIPVSGFLQRQSILSVKTLHIRELPKPQSLLIRQASTKDAAHGVWTRLKANPWILISLTTVSRKPLGAFFCTVLYQATLGDREARQRLHGELRKKPFKYFVSTPLTASFVGWLTNFAGVQMLFYPLHWRGIPLLPRKPLSPVGDLSPLGWIGWQGIVAAKAPRMARDLVKVVTNKLISPAATLRRLNARKLANFVDVPLVMRKILGLKPDQWPIILETSDATSQQLRAEYRRLAVGVASDIRTKGAECLNLEALCIRELSGSNVKALVDLFQKVGRVELRFLVISGLYVGFFLGLIQALLSASLSPKYFNENKRQALELLGAAIVGAVTNWVALLWIFVPVEPRVFFGGRIILQGCFMRRQSQVAIDFAHFFASRVLTARQLLADLLVSPTFQPLLRRRVASFLASSTKIFKSGGQLAVAQAIADNSDLLDITTARISTVLPHTLPDACFDYVDSTLDLGNSIGHKLATLPPHDYERLLHPIFQEDESTLIAVGGVLGILASYMQLRLLAWWQRRARERNTKP